MPAYLVTLDRAKSGHQLVGGADAMVVFAADTTTAKQVAASKYEGDGLAWLNDSTATAIASPANWQGWRFDVTVLGGGAGGAPISATFTADGTNNTMDQIGAQLVIALNATQINAASYNATSNTLTAADVADALGNQKLSVQITPPGGKSPIAALVGTIVDGGVSGAALTVVLPADAAVIPALVASVTQAD